ncbi:hypothetical protein [Pectinatus frisingensis]|uniref:hypothetical protein n=1 Tax=Pectinatus frisingensis TaxID=865 RepID=UPI0018C5130B|nr:hypothetical protein [Pectinatus frisingensis]
MKLPNGFGSVYKLSGNRRRPYVVKKKRFRTDRNRSVILTHTRLPLLFLSIIIVIRRCCRQAKRCFPRFTAYGKLSIFRKYRSRQKTVISTHTDTANGYIR